MSFREFVRELNGNRVEGELVKTILYSLLTSFIILVFYYFVGLNRTNFLEKYGFYLFFSVLSYSLIILSIRQVRAYKYFGCMSGMMVGMTTGMIAGFLSGFFVGSTNGMFWGSVFGMFVGISVGIYNGKCCGVMGVMEGITSGFMGGLMGAMTAIMMYNDNLKAAGIIVFLISSIVMLGLNFMIYSEMREKDRELKEGYVSVIFLSFILTTATVLMMVFGPRSVLFG